MGGEVVQRVLAGEKWLQFTCTRCGNPGMRHIEAPFEDAVCASCRREVSERERLDLEFARFKEKHLEWLDAWMKHCGLSKREITARTDLIPTPVMTAISRVLDDNLSQGFGLSGGAGCGKTFALASLFRRRMLDRWQKNVEVHGLKSIKEDWFTWVSWPEAVSRMRVLSLRDGGHGEIEAYVESLSAIECLVLDDLGAERLRGTYESDFAASQLDAIVDTRYNEMLPVWYTTNLTKTEFLERYGSRLFSRLTSNNPFLAIPGSDLRFQK